MLTNLYFRPNLFGKHSPCEKLSPEPNFSPETNPLFQEALIKSPPSRININEHETYGYRLRMFSGEKSREIPGQNRPRGGHDWVEPAFSVSSLCLLIIIIHSTNRRVHSIRADGPTTLSIQTNGPSSTLTKSLKPP